MTDALVAPFPYAGGKSSVAAVIWERLGDTANYVEAFAGSLAVLLARPDAHRWWERTETVNDLDGMVSNFWRAVQADPDAVARWADWPVSEPDLHARHLWLVARKPELQARLMGNPDYYDAKIAGWWLWGICQWIGSGWCSGQGPWRQVDGELVHIRDAATDGVWKQRPHLGSDGMGVNRKLPHLGSDGRGIKRQRPHLGDDGMGVNRQLPHLGDDGMGVNRKLPHLGSDGRGVNRKLPHLGSDGRGQCEVWSEHLRHMMGDLSDRLRRVRVCCGDWSRVCGPTPTVKLGLTGVFLDPPYALDGRASDLYSVEMDTTDAVREWAIERGRDPLMRVVLAGYDGEHVMPADWECVAWKARGGYGSQGDEDGRGRANSERERLWFSPHCIRPDAPRQASFLEELA